MTVSCTERPKPEGGEGLVGSPSKSKGQTIHIAQAGAGQTGLEHLVKTGQDPYTIMKQDDETSHKSTWCNYLDYKNWTSPLLSQSPLVTTQD